MKRFLPLFFISLFTAGTLSAQVFYTEDFSTAGAGWTLNVVTGPEGADPNFWKSSAEEGGGLAPGSCGVANNANNTLFVTSVFNPTGGAAYDAGGLCGVLFCPQADRRTESPIINCTGKSTITLNFNYIEGGDALNDNATVWYNDGTGWVLLDDPAKTALCGAQGKWTAYSFALPASANNNPSVQIGFRWVNNDDGVGTDPSFAVDDITLSVASAKPVVTITPLPNDSICQGSTLTLNGSATNGPITVWSWSVTPSAGVVFAPNAATPSVTVTFTASGTYTFTLNATGPGGVGDTTQVITVLPTLIPVVAITPDVANPVCTGTPVTFTATPTNGGTTPSYQWAVNGIPGGSNSTIFGPTVFVNGDVVSVILTSNATCASPSTVTATYTVQVTTPSAPTVTVTPNPASACSGSSITFTATPTNGGAAPSYQWVVSGVNAGANTSTFTLSGILGGELVSVILTSNGTCISTPTANSNTVTVGITPSPTTSITHGTATVCPGIPDTLIVKATAGSTFSWSPAAGLNVTANDSVIATNAAIGVYTYYVTATKGGCSHTDSVLVTVSNNLVASVGPNATVCAGQSAPLSVIGGIKWSWVPTGTTCDTCKNTVATPTATTIYTVTASNGGCFTTLNETITVIPNAAISFSTSVTSQGIPQTISFTNTTTNANSYYWTFDTDPINSVQQTPFPHVYPAEGTYTVTLIAYGNNGCNDTLSTVLTVMDTVGINFPNIFTPNGDEINDYWKPGAHGVKDLECVIYDRWGLKVYEFIGPQDKWDGHTTAGLMCKNGTYYYILKATDNNNKSYEKTGYIQLIH